MTYIQIYIQWQLCLSLIYLEGIQINQLILLQYLVLNALLHYKSIHFQFNGYEKTPYITT